MHVCFSVVDLLIAAVQTSNDAALAFYPKFGFVATATIPEYYKRIEPTTAVLLEYFPATSSAPLAVSPA